MKRALVGMMLAVMLVTGVASAETSCEMARAYGGKALYWNVLCAWDLLTGWE